MRLPFFAACASWTLPKALLMNSPHADIDSPVAALIRSQQALQSDPNDAAARFEQALALCRLGKWEQAVTAWEQVVRLEPDNAFAYINMGVIHSEQGQWAQAEQAFAQALRCRPEQPAAHYGLGMAYAQQGRQEEAQSAWERTLQLEPGHSDAQTNLAVLKTLAAEEFDAPPVECVVTSQINLLATPESMEMEDAQAHHIELSGAEAEHRHGYLETASEDRSRQVSRAAQADAPLPTPETQDKPRIKLPPVIGPSLASIAGAVIAAQSQPASDKATLPPPDAASGQNAVVGDGNAALREQNGVEPTLRLDAKALQRGHRALKRQEQAGMSPFLSGRNLLAVGAVGVFLLLSAAWGVQQNRAHNQPALFADTASAAAPPPASTASAATNPVVTESDTDASSASQANSALTAPPAALPSASASSAALPTAPDAAPERPATLRGTTQVEAASVEMPGDEPLPRPHSRLHSGHSRALSENDARSDQAAAVHTHAPRIGKARAAKAGHIEGSPASERLASSRRESAAKHASGTHRNAGSEEDTFASHAQPKHGDNGEEWTDKIP